MSSASKPAPKSKASNLAASAFVSQFYTEIVADIQASKGEIVADVPMLARPLVLAEWPTIMSLATSALPKISQSVFGRLEAVIGPDLAEAVFNKITSAANDVLGVASAAVQAPVVPAPADTASPTVTVVAPSVAPAAQPVATPPPAAPVTATAAPVAAPVQSVAVAAAPAVVPPAASPAGAPAVAGVPPVAPG
jgi:hypothetical protein